MCVRLVEGRRRLCRRRRRCAVDRVVTVTALIRNSRLSSRLDGEDRFTSCCYKFEIAGRCSPPFVTSCRVLLVFRCRRATPCLGEA